MEILSLPSLRAYTYTSIYIDIIYIYICARYWWHRCVCTGPLCWFSFFSFPFFLFFFFSTVHCGDVSRRTSRQARACTHAHAHTRKRKETKLGFSSIYLSVYPQKQKNETQQQRN
ncbi:hypothetical protein LINJ_36_1330 [Leishmania infantum JPCM5]|uniref:Uncharacterized protein n=2 Tax=Leishmania infantum TaxID=5671 RepID=E9AHX2_LEIIN|nr:hypothetical protein LINJ_36_1330 [Leishmania infantum JPCM5]CAC9549465.1 hypothetical_protein [Leishmania infantum]CBZ09029.1 hypothetical protein LINJ_36_1330 [Leishmania infantum JPCM5]SUZ46505.1 hypothetical_protein [Leishmania infantum]|eukprot:XP_003392823.1 hypothetical protein LINJ_36_1330 [Leishmania infantum JPCM5]